MSKIDNPRIRVAAIIEEKGSFLLVNHRKDDKSYYLFPGGGVESGETIEQALIREVEEETGYIIKLDKLLLLNDSIAPDLSRHLVNIYFSAKIISQSGKKIEEKRISGHEFKTPQELMSLDLRPNIKSFLQEFFKNKRPQSAAYLGNIWE